MSTSDMPTVDDLRAIARAALEGCRGERKLPRHWSSDALFAKTELAALGRLDVYDAEVRRHELLLRGFTPPIDGDRIAHPRTEAERCVHLAGELQALRNHVAHWHRAGVDSDALARADEALRTWGPK